MANKKNNIDNQNFKLSKITEESEDYLKWRSLMRKDQKYTTILILFLLATGYYLFSTNSYEFTVWSLICFGVSVLLIFYNIGRKINLDAYNKIQIESKILENKKAQLKSDREKIKLKNASIQKHKENMDARIQEQNEKRYQEQLLKRLEPLELAKLQVNEISKIEFELLFSF